MSGIDKIIRQIEEDTEAVCQEMISSAKSKADREIADAESEAGRIRDSFSEKTERKLSEIDQRAKSAAVVEEKKIMLKAKQDAIDTMLDAALSYVRQLPDDAYFALILQMAEKHSHEDDGVIFFSEKDLSRLPLGFEEKLSAVSKGRLSVSAKPREISSGFVLSYGGIEENCSFDSMIASMNETLRDRACAILF